MRDNDLAMLGLEVGATQKDIKKAYRKLVRQLHPDVNPEPRSVERFKKITLAYENLTAHGSYSSRGSEETAAPEQTSTADRSKAFTPADMDPDEAWRRCKIAVEALRIQSSSAPGRINAFLIAAEMLQEGVDSYVVTKGHRLSDGTRRPSILTLVDQFLLLAYQVRVKGEEDMRMHLVQTTIGLVGVRRVDSLVGRGAIASDKEVTANAIMSVLSQALLDQGVVGLPAQVTSGSDRAAESFVGQMVTDSIKQLKALPGAS